MTKIVDYYFAPVSPWAYLGHSRFAELLQRHGAAVNVKPIDLARVFPATGGQPLAKRAPARQAYRLVELARWRDFLRMPLNIEPLYFPADGGPASRLIIAVAAEQGTDAAMALAGALLRAVWAEERNIADVETLSALAKTQGLAADVLIEASRAPAVDAQYAAFSDEAIAQGAFGSPSYVYQGELFWGQDRLDFLDRALAA